MRIRQHSVLWLFILITMPGLSCHTRQTREPIQENNMIDYPLDTFISYIQKNKREYPEKEIRLAKISSFRDTTYLTERTDTTTQGSQQKIERYHDTTDIFLGKTTISQITLNNYLDRNRSLFHGPFTMSHCTLKSTDFNEFEFERSQFDSSALFHQNIDSDDFRLTNCLFKGPLTILVDDTSRKEFNFQTCTTGQGINFSYASGNPSRAFRPRIKSVFGNVVAFYECNLIGKADFSYCQFLGPKSIRFNGTALPDTLDLSHTVFNATLDLTEAIPNPRHPYCYITLYGEDIKKIRFKYNYFRLYFPPSMTDDEISSTYELVKATMKENGFDDSYQKVDCEFQQTMIRRKDVNYSTNVFYKLCDFITLHNYSNYINAVFNRLRPGAILDTIDRHWWNYGYNKEKILKWTFYCLLLFSFLNNFIYKQLMKTYLVENLERKRFPYTQYTFLRLSRNYFLSFIYTCFIFFKVGIDFQKVSITKINVFLIILFQYLIGLACTGFLLNWILKG